jgi:hypothetical protein
MLLLAEGIAFIVDANATPVHRKPLVAQARSKRRAAAILH